MFKWGKDETRKGRNVECRAVSGVMDARVWNEAYLELADLIKSGARYEHRFSLVLHTVRGESPLLKLVQQFPKRVSYEGYPTDLTRHFVLLTSGVEDKDQYRWWDRCAYRLYMEGRCPQEGGRHNLLDDMIFSTIFTKSPHQKFMGENFLVLDPLESWNTLEYSIHRPKLEDITKMEESELRKVIAQLELESKRKFGFGPEIQHPGGTTREVTGGPRYYRSLCDAEDFKKMATR
jgi:hypothetical protein